MPIRSVFVVLVLQFALALVAPTFWMIDIMQAQTQSPKSDVETSELTLRFDESRSQQETLDEHDLVVDDSGTPPLGDEDPEPDPSPVLTVSAHALHASVHSTGLHIHPPSLTATEVQRLKRCILPLSPALEVPTTPPLVAV